MSLCMCLMYYMCVHGAGGCDGQRRRESRQFRARTSLKGEPSFLHTPTSTIKCILQPSATDIRA